MDLSRRDLLKWSVFSAAAVALPLERSVAGLTSPGARIAESQLPLPFTTSFAVPRVAAPIRSDATTDYYRLIMRPTEVEIVPGLKTPMWGFDGQVPGPTFQVQQGRRSVVRLVNQLPATHPSLGYTPWSSTHLHGSASLPQFDGYASDVTYPGQYKDYRYPNHQVARTLWYHDHGVHHTAENVAMGLAGQYHLHDAQERALAIPRGEYDVPLTISDAMFNADGTLLIDNNDESGIFGDVILVNGRPWPVMKVRRRKYRFRLLNASVSRSYEWWLDTGDPMAVIATDGGLMPAPQYVQTLHHGVAERYEVIIDFARYRAGQRVILRNTSPDNNIDFTHTDKVMAFDVVNGKVDKAANAVPPQLNPSQPTMMLRETDSVATRVIELVREHGQWTINGTTWQDVIDSGFTSVIARPTIDDIEVWELRNMSGGWHHPLHIHFVDFQVLDRNGAPPRPHELGPKDVVSVGENEAVRVLMKFESGRGKYMLHCHNLVHEDHDMMTQFEIHDPELEADHPLNTPARWLPEGEL